MWCGEEGYGGVMEIAERFLVAFRLGEIDFVRS